MDVPQGLYIPARTTQTRRQTKPQNPNRSSLDGRDNFTSPTRPVATSEASRQLAIQPAVPPTSSFALRPILPAAVRTAAEDSSRPQLAPLEYLQNITPPKRHDIDDDYLRQFRHVQRI